MTYSSVPNSGESLDQTRDPIRNNFDIITTAQSVNHVQFDAAGQGKHKFLQMPDQGSAPTTAPNESGFYGKAVSGVSQLFYRGENNGSEYQLTYGTDGIDANIATFGNNSGTNSSGWTFLPGGLILQYGLRTVAAKGTATTITFPKNFTATPFSITIGNVTGEGNSPGENNQFIKDGSITTSQFQIVNSSSSSSRKVYWMALGN